MEIVTDLKNLASSDNYTTMNDEVQLHTATNMTKHQWELDVCNQLLVNTIYKIPTKCLTTHEE